MATTSPDLLDGDLFDGDPVERLLELSPDELGERIDSDRIGLKDGLRDAVRARGEAYHQLLVWVRRASRAELHRAEGHPNETGFVAAELGVGNYEAARMIRASRALECLPAISSCLRNGELSPPKVLELIRFATPENEARLAAWAQRVSPKEVRYRADRELLTPKEELRDSRTPSLSWEWSLERDRLHLWGVLPPEQGTAVIEAIDAVAAEIAPAPEGAAETLFDGDDGDLEARRAAALLELVTSGPDEARRPTVVLHAPLASLSADESNCVLDSGTVVVDPEAARALCCDARIEVVVEDENGSALGIGRRSKDVPRWLRRQVLYRDHHVCAFPGCERRRFLRLHHMRHWARGGRTELDNLITLCHFHHALIHDRGWSVVLGPDRTSPIWFRPSGRRYEPGPDPPEKEPPPTPEPDLHLLARAAGFSRLFEATRLIQGPD